MLRQVRQAVGHPEKTQISQKPPVSYLPELGELEENSATPQAELPACQQLLTSDRGAAAGGEMLLQGTTKII